ncbi:DUF2946 family protein [Solimonas flava]|uniref:DUF2946 family protein n=1 Tax=Solimonas flava TaxID=415849 RepID=UPI000409452D|nr:DUF2946 family protein [Solimonas flava]
MEDWVHRALQRWPNVPALFGWLALDRRGRWLIRGEPITRPQIIDTIDRNYGVDAYGRWYFQNGPQRGYMKLEAAPFVLRVAADGAALRTHTGLPVTAPTQAFLDEEGSLLLVTEHGPALLADHDLDWALTRLRAGGAPVGEAALAAALATPSGQPSDLELAIGDRALRVRRLDRAQWPAALGYVLDPQPRDGERATRGDTPA